MAAQNIFLLSMAVLLAVASVSTASPSMEDWAAYEPHEVAARTTTQFSFGGKFSFHCLIAADVSSGVATTINTATQQFACKVFFDGTGASFLLCDGRYALSPSASYPVVFNFDMVTPVNGARYVVVRINSAGDVKVVLASDADGTTVISSPLVSKTGPLPAGPDSSPGFQSVGTVSASSIACKSSVEPFFVKVPV
eukprot:Opistho-2@17455